MEQARAPGTNAQDSDKKMIGGNGWRLPGNAHGKRDTMKFHWAAITSLPRRIDGFARPLAIHPEHGVVCVIFTKANL